MRFIFGLAVFVSILMVWSLWGRDWLKARNSAATNAFFAWYEPIEVALFENSKTIFIARLKVLTGLLLTLGTQIGQIDIAPIMPFVPEAWQGSILIAWNMLPLSLSILGGLDEYLRRSTTQPTETVALTEEQKQQPEMAAALEKLDVAKAVAVAVSETVRKEAA